MRIAFPSKATAAICLSIFLFASPFAAAQEIPATQVIERIDRYVLSFGKSFKGGPAQMPGALLQSELKAQTLNLTDAEWKAIASKIDRDLAALERRGAEQIAPAVFEFDFAKIPPEAPFAWQDAPEPLLLLMRAYDAASVAKLGASVALPQHLPSVEDFGKETVLWGFTSSEVFVTTIDGRDALASAQGNWITTTTFQRTPKGLIKPEVVRLHPRYRD
jgi:hypothetical protein